MRALLLIDYMVLALIGAQAHAGGALHHFDIQSQAAAPALNEFAGQADITLVFSSTLVAKYQTAAVRGDFTVADGLRKLLDGTGLSFNQLSISTIAISAASAAEVKDPPTSGIDAATEPATNERQSKG
jgi:iron complex outermembrane receptor protein